MPRSVLHDLLDTYVCVRDAVAILGVSRQRVVALCQQGKLPGAQLAYGRWMIPRAAIDARKRRQAKSP